MPSLRMLWNVLAPWRRRRRYYFLQVLAQLRRLGVEPSAWPDALNVTSLDFIGLCSGYDNPPRYVETLAIVAYRVPAPPGRLIWGPAVLCLTANAVGALIYFLMLR